MFPLPVEGAETKVLADDQEVSNYMIDLGDLLETVRGKVLLCSVRRELDLIEPDT